MQNWTVEGNVTRQVGKIIFPLVSVSLLGFACPAFSREINVSAEMKVSYEKFLRRYDNEAQTGTALINLEDSGGEDVVSVDYNERRRDDKYDRFRIAPLVELTSVTARDDMSLRYSPSFRYDNQTSNHDIDHDLHVSIKRLLTRDWRVLLTENYLLTDRVYDQGSTDTDNVVTLSDNGSRRKYWTNNVKILSEYSYWENSLLSTGYNFGILENTEGTDSDYYRNHHRHEIQFSLRHQYTSIWNFIIAGSYVRGLFDVEGGENGSSTDLYSDNDLNEYRASTTIESGMIDHHPLSLSYSYFAVHYDAGPQGNGAIHDLTFGWQWLIAKDWTSRLGGGPSWVEQEGEDATWGYNANISLQHSFEDGSWALSATRGYDRQNFSGTNESGLNEFWQSRLDVKYRLQREVSWLLFTAYRYEDREMTTRRLPSPTDSGENAILREDTQKTETFNRQRFSVGTGIEYTFWKVYSAGLSYDYAVQDSEMVNDSYDEHRLLLTLSIRTDLFNW
jgi:hypothetical protein